MSIPSAHRPRNRAIGDDPIDPEDEDVLVNVEEVQLEDQIVPPEIVPPGIAPRAAAAGLIPPVEYIPPAHPRSHASRRRGGEDSDESTLRADYSSDEESRHPPPRRRASGRQANAPPYGTEPSPAG